MQLKIQRKEELKDVQLEKGKNMQDTSLFLVINTITPNLFASI
jgi:hypothetical protein